MTVNTNEGKALFCLGIIVASFQPDFGGRLAISPSISKVYKTRALAKQTPSPIISPSHTPPAVPTTDKNLPKDAEKPSNSSVSILQTILTIIPPLLAVIVSVLTSLATGGWGIYKHIIARREKKRADEEARRANEEKIRADYEKSRADQSATSIQEIREALEDRIGYRIQHLEIRAFIKNFKGDCHTEWVWRDIKKVRTENKLSRFSGRMQFSPTGCTFLQYPTLSYEAERDYAIDIITQEASVCEFFVIVKNHTDVLGYDYSADISKAFFMFEEDLQGQSYPYEWFGFYISSVFENLTIKVRFPTPYTPNEIGPDAYIGGIPTVFNDQSEIDRIKNFNGFTVNSKEAIMTVKKPMIGYTYCIRWIPSSKEDLKAITNEHLTII